MNYFKKSFLIFIFLPLFSCNVVQKRIPNLYKTAWNSGSTDCNENTDPAIQVVKYNSNTWILRQNKCVHYEAPFMYLFIGENKAILMDTGATEEENKFPLYETVRKLMAEWEEKNNAQLKLIVAHTHSHGDHFAADNQFKNKLNTTIVGLEVEEVSNYFKLINWPLKSSELDLGNRVLEIIPIPGHQKASIAVYDRETHILLTGDSFYPGRLYIKDWLDFKSSTQRLLDFTASHKISYMLGNHIEMSTKAGIDYPTGTTFQPQEHPLPLKIKDLKLLNTSLKKLGDIPKKVILDDFIIYPK